MRWFSLMSRMRQEWREEDRGGEGRDLDEVILDHVTEEAKDDVTDEAKDGIKDKANNVGGGKGGGETFRMTSEMRQEWY